MKAPEVVEVEHVHGPCVACGQDLVTTVAVELNLQLKPPATVVTDPRIVGVRSETHACGPLAPAPRNPVCMCSHVEAIHVAPRVQGPSCTAGGCTCIGFIGRDQ